MASALPTTPTLCLEKVKSELLGQPLRVTLSDGRLLQGRLHCLDWKQNILLRDSSELTLEGGVVASRKSLGLVAIEAKDVTSVQCAAAPA